MWLFIYIMTGIPVFLYVLWKWSSARVNGNNDYWPKRGVPQVLETKDPNCWKILIGKIPPNIVDAARYNKYPDAPFVGLLEFKTPILMMRDPDLVKKMTVKDFHHFVDRKKFHASGETNDQFLFSATGINWKNMRAAMTRTFTSGKMRQMFQHFEKSSQELVDFVEKHNNPNPNPKAACGNDEDEKCLVLEFETREAFSRFAMDVIGSTAFGIDSECLVNEESPFYKMARVIEDRPGFSLSKFLLIRCFPKLSELLGIHFDPQKPIQFFTTILGRHLASRQQQQQDDDDEVKNASGNSKKGVPSDFLQLMVQAQKQNEQVKQDEDDPNFERDAKIQNPNEGQDWISDSVIIANSFGFFITQFLNTEPVLTTAAYHLAIYPEYQQRLREEVDRIVVDYDGKVTYDGVVKMTFLDMFISECLRLYAPVTRFRRIVTKEYTIPEIGEYPQVTLPLGSVVYFPVMAFHKDAKYWPNPDVFDPERFNPENKAERHPYVYMPFGHGPRSCIAMRFVLTEIKAAVAHLVLRFEIRTCQETTIPMKLHEVNGQHRPAAGLKLALAKRN